jgi:hypothetical protein
MERFLNDYYFNEIQKTSNMKEYKEENKKHTPSPKNNR